MEVVTVDHKGKSLTATRAHQTLSGQVRTGEKSATADVIIGGTAHGSASQSDSARQRVLQWLHQICLTGTRLGRLSTIRFLLHY